MEAEQGTAVAVNKQSVPTCELLAAPFFGISETMKLVDIEPVMHAFDHMLPCARRREDCETPISATPWRLLDVVSDAHARPKVLFVSFDPDLSNENQSQYQVQFSLDAPRQRFVADIIIANGRVKSMSLGQIVP